MESKHTRRKESRKRYYEKNKERILLQQKEASKKRHADPIARAKYCEKQRIYLREHYETRLLSSIKYRCKKENIPFNLDIKDLNIPSICPKTGIPLVVHMEKGKFWDTPSVDRIDPTKGYIKGNIQIVCLWYNIAKLNWDESIFITMCKNVVMFNNE